MKKEKSHTVKKHLSKLVVIICLGVFIYAAYGLIDILTDYNQGKRVANEVKETYYTSASTVKKTPTKNKNQELTIRPEFKDLLEENQDVVGWITIDDTKIDYPILHSSDNIDYLTKDFYKNESALGSIFLDYRNSVKPLGKNTVIYGHRTKDGSMFQHMTKFMDEDFFENHQTFEFETLYESYEAKIISVYNTTTYFNYIETDFSSDEEYEEFLTNIIQESKYEINEEVDSSDKIITLSTCDYELDENDGRLVIHAKLIKK